MRAFSLIALAISTAILASATPFPSTIPVVDMRDFDNPQTRQKFVDELSSALHNVGFFAVINPGIDVQALRVAYDASQQFFESPLEQKKLTYIPSLNGQRGYVPSERAQGQVRKDSKEFFHFSHINNVWPNWMDFETPMCALQASLDEHSRKLEIAISLALGQREDFLTQMTTGAPSMMRALHYPANPTPGTYWAAPHTDINLFTILPMATEEGLQVLYQGEYIDVRVPEDAFIINGADMLENMSNGYFKSSYHQVIAKPNVERYSIVYFIHALLDADLTPLPSCIEMTGGIQQFPRATELDMLAHRLVELDLASPELCSYDANSGYMERIEALVLAGVAAPAVLKSYNLWQKLSESK